MPSAASRRALGQLAARVHPPLPLSPRRSQQLLELLTTSFRAQLDREHPVAAQSAHGSITPSSYRAAADHIDGILSNPLLARTPRPKASQPAALHVLNHPLEWFLDQVAIGAADLPKAAICLGLLDSAPVPQPRPAQAPKPASLISAWLQDSGFDTSAQFRDMLISRRSTSLNRLVPMLIAEDNQAPLWRWLTRVPEQPIRDTGMHSSRISSFRTYLLKDMVLSTQPSSFDGAMAIFLRACSLPMAVNCDSASRWLRPAGAALVDQIIAHPHATKSPSPYESFLQSTSKWLGEGSNMVQAMLWLHHPTQPTALPGLSFIQDPQGAKRYVTSRKSRQQFLVRLCLGVARQLIEEERFSDAQVAMDFTEEHFTELVKSKTAPSPRLGRLPNHVKAQKELAYLKYLDDLLPT